MPPVVRAQHHIPRAGESRHVRFIPFGGPVDLRRDVTVVEDDHRPAACRLFPERNRQQRVNLVALREIRDDVLGIAVARRQRLLKDQLAAGVLLLPHDLDGQRVGRRRRGRWAGGRRGRQGRRRRHRRRARRRRQGHRGDGGQGRLRCRRLARRLLGDGCRRFECAGPRLGAGRRQRHQNQHQNHENAVARPSAHSRTPRTWRLPQS